MTASIVTITVNPALDVSFEVERVVPEDKLRSTKPELHPGGGGINVARAATRLGAKVRALWLGSGCDAQQLSDLLDDEAVRHEGIPVRAEPRRSLHVEERTTGHMYRFVMPGEPLTESEGAHLCQRVAALEGVGFLVLSGSLAPGLPDDFYHRLAARAPAGTRVVLDTSGEALARGLAGRVYLAKPNHREMERLAGRPLPDHAHIAAAATELIRAGRVEVIAVSLAAEGLLLVTADGHEHLPAPRVEMVSAVGAGDCTVAGIVTGLARGWSLPESVRLGAAAGAATVLTAGTQLCRREDTERLYAELSAR